VTPRPGDLTPGPGAPRVRVLNLDDGIDADGLRASGVEVVEHDLRGLGPRTRFLCGHGARREFAKQLDTAHKQLPTLYGSGDFHHLTLSLLAQFHEPLTLILFDQHPDWDIMSPWPCCGCWVNEALALPAVSRVVVLGAGRPDLHGWHLARGNMGAVRSGELEIYPYSWRTSLCPGRIEADLACGTIRPEGLKSRVTWRTIRRHGLLPLVRDVISRLPERRIYLSIDKDVLAPDFATTNWEPGEMQLDELLEAVTLLGTECQILGSDLTGDFSPASIRSSWISGLSRLNHPKQPPISVQKASSHKNLITNAALIHAILCSHG